MSKALAIVMVWVLCAPTAVAQSDAARHQKTADSLLALWRQARDLANVQHQLHDVRSTHAVAITRATAATRGLDPIQVGDVMILTNRPDALPFRSSAAAAWSIVRRTYGNAALPLVVQPIRMRVVYPDRRTGGFPNSRDVLSTVTPDVLTRALVSMMGSPKADSALRTWLGGAVQPLIDTLAARRTAYIQLVRAPARAARQCLTGDVKQCRGALLIDDDTTFIVHLYDAEDRHIAAAGTRGSNVLNSADRDVYTRCLSGHSDPDCIKFLQGLDPNQLPKPFPEAVRQLLVSTALEMGGPAAYDRLIADTLAPLADRLAAAAGAPVDSVVARWRRALIAARPTAPNVPLGDGLAAAGWIGVLAVCALRSSRWRVS